MSFDIFNVVEKESRFVWLVADGWCWFVLREKYCWLVADGWFVPREKYCWLVADKPSEQAQSREEELKQEGGDSKERNCRTTSQ
jgi:hypothetical protein